jgi:hypothetical protein
LFASRGVTATRQLDGLIAASLVIEVIDLSWQRMSAYDYEHRNRVTISSHRCVAPQL